MGGVGTGMVGNLEMAGLGHWEIIGDVSWTRRKRMHMTAVGVGEMATRICL